MVQFVFTVRSKKQFLALPVSDRERILAKLVVLKDHPNILSVLSILVDFLPATHRLRIGSYRLILQLQEYQKGRVVFLIHKVAHRKDVYK